MAGVYLSARSDAPGSSEFVLIDAEPSTTGYRLLNVDVGNPAFDKQYSGPRGTLGAVLAGETAQNRLSTFRLQAVGSSQDDLETKLSALWLLDEQLRRYGGIVTWRPQGGSYRMRITALDSGIALEALDVNLFVLNNRANVNFGVISGPYYEGEPMDILDTFAVDSKADYTFDTGSAAEVAVSAGVLGVSSAPTTEKRMIHTARAYNYGDTQATVKAAPGSTISSFLAGVVLRRLDATNYLRVYVDDNATNSRLRIDKVVAGTPTNVTTTNLGARVANGVPFWVRGRIEGANVIAEYFLSAPSPMATPTTTNSYTLSSAEQTTFAAAGKAGIVWIPQQSAATLDDFSVEPYTYRGVTTPDYLPLIGAVPGDAPALAEAVVTPSGGSAAPIWGMFGWWPRRLGYNFVQNGDFENVLLAALTPWSVAAVTNISGAATSIARITTAAKYGVCSGQIVCPATADTGANYRMFRQFKKGVTYTFECWVHAASAVTNVYLKFGNGAAPDVATSGAATALSTTWQRLSLTWTPTANRSDAHISVLIQTATATTFEIDGVQVYEGTTAPASPNQTEGRGGFPPFGVVEAENLVGGVLSNETQQITLAPDMMPQSSTLTFEGQTTGTIVFTQTTTAFEVRTALEGLSNIAPGDVEVSLTTGGVYVWTITFKGALAATNRTQMTASNGNIGISTIIQGGVAPLVADGAYRSGFGALPSQTGATYIARVVIDPALMVPDDYTQDELAVEVWSRQTTVPGGQVVRVAAWPLTATATVPAVTTEEYGAVGKTTIGSSTGTPLRFMRLGTLRLRTNLGRYLLVWEATSGGAQLDYFVLVPANARALSPSGKVGDITYPAFVPSTAEISKRILPDLSATIREPSSGTPEVNAAGLGGSLLELQPGNNALLCKLSSLVPDDPTLSTTAEQLAHTATVHLAVTPRWRLSR